MLSEHCFLISVRQTIKNMCNVTEGWSGKDKPCITLRQ